LQKIYAQESAPPSVKNPPPHKKKEKKERKTACLKQKCQTVSIVSIRKYVYWQQMFYDFVLLNFIHAVASLLLSDVKTNLKK
jgi:hypothetical protein